MWPSEFSIHTFIQSSSRALLCCHHQKRHHHHPYQHVVFHRAQCNTLLVPSNPSQFSILNSQCSHLPSHRGPFSSAAAPARIHFSSNIILLCVWRVFVKFENLLFCSSEHQNFQFPVIASWFNFILSGMFNFIYQLIPNWIEIIRFCLNLKYDRSIKRFDLRSYLVLWMRLDTLLWWEKHPKPISPIDWKQSSWKTLYWDILTWKHLVAAESNIGYWRLLAGIGEDCHQPICLWVDTKEPIFISRNHSSQMETNFRALNFARLIF